MLAQKTSFLKLFALDGIIGLKAVRPRLRAVSSVAIFPPGATSGKWIMSIDWRAEEMLPFAQSLGFRSYTPGCRPARLPTYLWKFGHADSSSLPLAFSAGGLSHPGLFCHLLSFPCAQFPLSQSGPPKGFGQDDSDKGKEHKTGN